MQADESSTVGGLSPEELCCEFVACDAEVIGDRPDDSGESTDAQRTMCRDRDVVFATLRRRQAHVATGLSADAVAERSESRGEIGAG